MSKPSFNGFVLPKPDKKGNNVINSIQTGSTTIPGDSVTISATVNISHVETSKSVIIVSSVEDGGTPNKIHIKASFNSPTQILLEQIAGSPVVNQITWTVIEFTNIKSFQSGSYTHTGNGSESTVNVTDVTATKCLLFFTYTDSNATGTYTQVKGRIISSTQIGFYRKNMTTGQAVINWSLVEFF